MAVLLGTSTTTQTQNEAPAPLFRLLGGEALIYSNLPNGTKIKTHMLEPLFHTEQTLVKININIYPATIRVTPLYIYCLIFNI